MFYLTTLEVNVLFNDAPNTFYLRAYDNGSFGQRERKPAAATTWTVLSYYQQYIFYMHQPTDRIVRTMACVNPLREDLLERGIAQWVHHEGSIRRP